VIRFWGSQEISILLRDKVISVKNVKEFIKKLKAKVRDEINNPYTQKPTVHLGIVLKWINELAGDKLKWAKKK